MKKLLLFGALALSILSCSDEQAATKTYQGNFLATDKAAVLEVNEEMYAVTYDDMAKELAQKITASQESEHDMVPVTIEAVVAPKPVNTEGWDSILTIKKIIAVSPSAVAPDIKIEESN
ncbi:MAG: hypothetical protein ABJM06_12015 [Gilvibacter sp.]